MSARFSRVAVFIAMLVITAVRQPALNQRSVGVIAGSIGLCCSLSALYRPGAAFYLHLVLAVWVLLGTIAMPGRDAFLSASYVMSALAVVAFSVIAKLEENSTRSDSADF
jgi:hypothetical protein